MLSVIDLLPSSIENLCKENSYFKTIIFSFLCFWIGFFGCHFISKLMHNESSKLYKTGIISMLGIVLHNIPEGIATFVLSAIDLKLGLFLAIAIILHNVPEGIGIAIPIFYSTNSKKNAFLYTFISGISEPLGGLFALLFLYKYINNSIIGFLFSFIAGLMIYIGYFELLKTSRYYDNKKNNYESEKKFINRPFPSVSQRQRTAYQRQRHRIACCPTNSRAIYESASGCAGHCHRRRHRGRHLCTDG